MSRRRLLLLIVALVVVAAVAGGVVTVVGGRDDDETPPPETAPITLADLDTTKLTLTRASFCEGLSGAVVGDALAVDDFADAAYDDGERTKLTDRIEDIAHEFGCVYLADDGSALARAWVFAPPVTPAQGRALVASAEAARSCRSIPDAAGYGRISTGLVCLSDGKLEVSYRGLFGDAWLACTLTTRDDVDRVEVGDRASRWCAAVARAASRR